MELRAKKRRSGLEGRPPSKVLRRHFVYIARAINDFGAWGRDVVGMKAGRFFYDVLKLPNGEGECTSWKNPGSMVSDCSAFRGPRTSKRENRVAFPGAFKGAACSVH